MTDGPQQHSSTSKKHMELRMNLPGRLSLVRLRICVVLLAVCGSSIIGQAGLSCLSLNERNRMTHWLNNRLGRRGTVFVTCFISSACSFSQYFPNTWRKMLLARFFLGPLCPILSQNRPHVANKIPGLGIGPKSATIPIWAAESAPSNIRG